MLGLFGGLFDFNHDGNLDGFERAAEFATFASILEESNRDLSGLDDDYDEDEYDDMFDDDF